MTAGTWRSGRLSSSSTPSSWPAWAWIPRPCPIVDDQSAWPALTAVLQEAFARRTRDEWAAVFDGTDACVTPVLDYREAAEHVHLKARGSVTRVGGRLSSGPAPRFASTRAHEPADAQPRPTTVDEVRAELEQALLAQCHGGRQPAAGDGLEPDRDRLGAIAADEDRRRLDDPGSHLAHAHCSHGAQA